MVKNPPANAGDMGLIPGLGRSPGGGNGNPLQYLPGKFSGQKSLVAADHGVTKSQTQLSMHTGRKNIGREVVNGAGRKS